MTRQYKRLSAQQWQAYVQQQASSGLSAPKFCEQHHISYANFSKWRYKLKQVTQVQQPITVVDDSTDNFVNLSALSVSGTWNITLSLGNGVELRLNQQ